MLYSLYIGERMQQELRHSIYSIAPGPEHQVQVRKSGVRVIE